MTNKSKWAAALVPYDPVTCEVDRRRTVFMNGNDDRKEQERFYKSLLELSWIAPQIRYAVMRELGLSKLEINRKIEQAACYTLYYQIEQLKADLHRNGKRPRGGVHAAAVVEIADRHGMTDAALKKRLERNGPTAAERRGIKELARRPS